MNMKSNFSLANKRVFVAGHNGMVGRALVRRLQKEHCEIVTISKKQCDLRHQQEVNNWFSSNRPDVVLLAAAKVGGIQANRTQQADFLYDNLAIASNVIHAAKEFSAQKLLFLGSSCIYPKLAPQPIKEESLLTSSLEPTNEGYAIAKIAGLKLVQYYHQQYGCPFISCMPTNLYGPYDNYDLENSHVLPALLRKIHEAKEQSISSVPIWGTGTPKREFLFVDDLADACIFLLQQYHEPVPINIGTGKDLTIAELADNIANIVGYSGNFTFDASMPDGTPRKCLDTSRINALGWAAQTTLEAGIQLTYEHFKRRSE